MTTWDITKAKFYSEMMNAIAAFFTIKTEDATEAELHERLSNLGTLEDLTSRVTAQATAAVQGQLDTLAAQITDLNNQVATLKVEHEAATAQITTLQTDLAAANTALTERDAKIANLEAQNRDLAGKLAAHQAGAPVTVAPADAALPQPNEAQANAAGGLTVGMDAFKGLLGKK